jgi:hypothetical protein
MKKSSILDQAKFWDIITFLVELDQNRSFDDLVSELCVNKNQLNSIIHFLEEVNCHFDVVKDGDDRTLVPSPENHKIVFEFSLVEWLQFQAHFPCFESIADKPYHTRLQSKLASIEEAYRPYDLFSPIKVLDNLYSNELAIVGDDPKQLVNRYVEIIEEAMLDNRSINIGLKNNDKNIKIFPRKIVFFDGDFNLIGEGIADSCLSNLSISQIETIEFESTNWEPIFSRRELDDFVSSLRFMAENTTRLVLKVFSQEKFHLNLDYQFIENPCMFSNPNGEYIWAATIEPNDTIFDWLYDLGPCVEILDPRAFKIEYFNYCENKLKKLA